MNRTKRLSGVCSQCGGSIEFPAELVGTTTQCPRCKKLTELTLPAPPEEPGVPRKVILWTVVTVVILLLGLAAAVFELKHLEKLVALQKERAAVAPGAKGATAAAGLEVSVISLEKGQGSSGAYAVGTVVNTSGRPRSRVTVELDLLDAAGQKVEVARAYRPVLERGGEVADQGARRRRFQSGLGQGGLDQGGAVERPVKARARRRRWAGGRRAARGTGRQSGRSGRPTQSPAPAGPASPRRRR